MKTRQLLYMVAALVVLGVIYWAMQRTSVPVAQVSYLAKIDSAKVTEVSIFKGSTTVTLAKKDTVWYITNPIQFRANDRYVKQLLGKLAGMKIASIITRTKDKWSEFEVDTAGTQVTVTMDGGAKQEFVVGKAASGYRHSYARLADKDEVDLIDGTYGLVLNRTVENWRDKKIIDFPASYIIGINTGDLVLTRDARESKFWVLHNADGSIDTTDNAKSTNIQTSIGRLQSSGFPKPEDYAKVNFKKPHSTLKLDLFNGVKHELDFYQDKDQTNRYYVKLDGDSTVYRIYEGIYNQIFKKKADIMPGAKPATPPAPATMKPQAAMPPGAKAMMPPNEASKKK